MPGNERSIEYNNKYQLIGYLYDLGAYINDIIVFKEYMLNELKKCIWENKYPTHENKKYNCDYVNKFGRIWVIATNNIEANRELFTSYGPDYWQIQMVENGWLWI